MTAQVAPPAESRVADYWSQHVAGSDAFGPQVYWLAIPEVQAHFQARGCGFSGHPSWIHYLLDTYCTASTMPAPRMLSLGCGSGALERDLFRLAAFAQCDAYDIAPGAIAIARAEAQALGCTTLRYEVRDIQRDLPDGGPYDAAWFNGSLHHIEALETVLTRVHALLRPGGYLFFNEYVGARHFDLPPAQRAAIDAAFRMLPRRYRRSFAPGAFGVELQQAPLPDWREVRRVDPSEAVRANEIMPLVHERFDVVVQNASGGSILQFLLSGLAGHFSAADPIAMRYLRAIMQYEDRLVDGGALPSDFVVVAARARH